MANETLVKSIMSTKIPNFLCALGIVVAFMGGFLGKNYLLNSGLIFAGGILLWFSQELNDYYIGLYKTTSPRFIRYSTFFAGILFVLFGILGFLGVQFGAR